MNDRISENTLKSFRTFVNKFILTDDKLFDTLISNFEYKKVARKELLLEASKTANKIFFLSIFISHPASSHHLQASLIKNHLS